MWMGQLTEFIRKTVLSRELMDDCGVMSAMTATTSGRAKFDFQAQTCFLQVSQMDTATAFRTRSAKCGRRS